MKYLSKRASSVCECVKERGATEYYHLMIYGVMVMVIGMTYGVMEWFMEMIYGLSRDKRSLVRWSE